MVSSSSEGMTDISNQPPRLAHGSHYDAVVVGAGIMGSCAAYHLAKRGKKVLLLEQFELLHRRGSSHGDSRIIRRTYPDPVNTEMMRHAYPLWESAQREAGQSVYTKTGGLDWGRRGSKDIESLIESCRRFNVEVDVMDAAQANARFPRQINLPDDYVAVYNADGGVIHATQAVAMFQRLAIQNGAQIVDRTKVVAITPGSSGGGSTARSTRGRGEEEGGGGDSGDGGGRVRVTTARGDIVTATSCVVTCGAWAGKLLRHLGYGVALQPIHTTYAFWRCESPEDFTPPAWPVFIHYADDPNETMYSTPCVEYPDLMKVALHTGPPCDPDTRTLVPGYDEAATHVSPFIRTFLKGVDFEKPALAEACMYTLTPDHNFVLDRVFLEDDNDNDNSNSNGWSESKRGAGEESGGKMGMSGGEGGYSSSSGNIVIGAGFSGHGAKMAPLIGSIMADLVTGATPPVDLAPFSLSRACMRAKRVARTARVEGEPAGISKL